MTFLKGQTTWEQFGPRLVAMVCGESGDDAGVVVPVAERWKRDPAAPTALSIVSPDSTAFTPPGFSYNRVGYWTALNNPFSYEPGVAPLDWGKNHNLVTTWIRVKTCFTSVPPYVNSTLSTNFPNTFKHRWFVQVVITASNTTANDYSTARVRVRVYDAAHNRSGGNYSDDHYLQMDNLVPTVDGTVTPGTNYPGLSFQIGDPSGIVKNYQNYMRMFTDATGAHGGYWGGIDFWPNLWRETGPIAFETGLVPPGVEGTDWAIARQIPPTANQWSRHRNGWGFGLGIKTNAALANDALDATKGVRYGVRWPMAQGKFHFEPRQSGTENGSMLLYPGGSYTDPVNSAFHATVGGYDPVRWLRPFTTPGSVNPTAPVQFWVRVKADSIIVMVNADPGFTGTTSAAWIVTLKDFPSTTQYEHFPMCWQGFHTPEAAFDDTRAWRHGTHQGNWWTGLPEFRSWGSYWGLSLYQNGFREAGRDWQTGWLRADFGTGKNWYQVLQVGFGTTTEFERRIYYGTEFMFEMNGNLNQAYPPQAAGFGINYACSVEVVDGVENGSQIYVYGVPNNETHPHPYDGNWRLYTYSYEDRGRADQTYAYESVNWGLRGYLDTGVYFLPGNNWASADELVDNASGNVYFLFTANYHQVLTRGATTPNGGIAVLES